MTNIEKIRAEIIELFKASGTSNSNLCYATLQLIYKYVEQEPKVPCDGRLCGFNTGEFCEYSRTCPAMAKGGE